jgi:hypothetical protein
LEGVARDDVDVGQEFGDGADLTGDERRDERDGKRG